MAIAHVEDAAGTEARLAAILSATGTGTWEWCAEDGRLRLGHEWLAVLGYAPGQLDTSPEGLSSLVHRGDWPRARRRLRALFAGVSNEAECVGRLRRQDGTYQWRRERCVVVERGPQGEPLRLVGVGTNITDLGQAGERAHPWEHVFDQTQLGLVVVSVADDTVLAVNEAYARMHGYDIDELLGRPVRLTCALPAGETSNIAKRVNEEGHLVGEFAHRRKDGNTFPAIHEINLVRNAAGVPVSRVGFVHDVSERAGALLALRQSEERFRAVYESAPVGILVFDADGRIHEANPAFCAMIGHSEQAVQNLPFRSLVYADDRDPDRGRVGRVLAGTSVSEQFEVRLLHRSGALVWTQVRVSAIPGSTPDSTRLLAVVEDITERRATHDVLRQREAELRTALEAADAGTFAFDMSTGAIQFSHRCRELYGFGADEPVTADEVTARTHPDDRAEVARRFEASIQTGGDYDVQYRVTAPSREPRWMHAKGRAIRDENGTVAHLVGVKIDVTERKLASERIEASEARFRLVALATRDVLWDWNVTTGAHWWSPNAVKLFGHDPSTEPTVEAWFGRLHPDDRGRLDAVVARVLGGTVDKFEADYRFRLADGTYGDFLDRGHVTRDAAGRAVRLIGAMTDVTELKRAHHWLVSAHERLRAASRDVHLAETRERAALARELHDEFGQLLTAAKMSASALRSMPLEGLHPDRCRQHDARTASLCEVLDLALLGVRNVATELRPPALDQLGLPRAIEGLAEQTERHFGLRCPVLIDTATRATVFGPVEGAALYRMAQELMTNAARHAAASAVDVQLTSGEGLVHLVVRDNGRGMPPADRLAPDAQGLKGLRERAELLGGWVATQSTPGGGTAVQVTLPVGDRE